MIIDLHTHSTQSDGEYSPSKVVRLAKENNIDVVAITDHDSTQGVAEAIEEGKKLGVKVIPGIEFSAYDPDCKKTHILGYNIDYLNPEFQKIYQEFISDVEKRNEVFIETFNSIDINITMDDIKAISTSANVRKPIFAKLLIQKGYIKEKEEAYENYFNKEPFRNIKKGKGEPSSKDIIKIIKKFGGTAVLAHPYSLGLEETDLEDKIDEYISYGLKGLECFHSRHTVEDMIEFEKIALERDMIITKGSDFHGFGVYPNTHIGTGNFDNLKYINSIRLNKIDKIISK